MFALVHDGTLFQLDDVGNPQQAFHKLTDGVTAIVQAPSPSPGTNVECALRRSGEVSCWPILGPFRPEAVAGVADATAIAAGAAHTCVLRRTGHVACWGARDRLGVHDQFVAEAPVTVPGVKL